ncbi:MAG: metallopeptidase family protein [Chloroflexi bacterium]|nr:metallopeptidase family protein [Chloroflexota bacterium]
MHLSETRFEQLVAEAIDALPEAFASRLHNVEVVVEGWPSRAQLRHAGVPHNSTLLGLYEGVPLTERTSGYGLVLPDKVTIFSGPIEQMCASEDELRAQIAHTIIHEFAHFFGISDDQLRRMGAY